jgi:hypothetical protein
MRARSGGGRRVSGEEAEVNRGVLVRAHDGGSRPLLPRHFGSNVSGERRELPNWEISATLTLGECGGPWAKRFRDDLRCEAPAIASGGQGDGRSCEAGRLLALLGREECGPVWPVRDRDAAAQLGTLGIMMMSPLREDDRS